MTVRIKICGITQPDHGCHAARAGCDAIGLMFYDKSPRAISINVAQEIIAVLPPFITTVAVFVDPTAQLVNDVIDRCQVDLLQFHGDETPVFCESFTRPYIKAIQLQPGMDIKAKTEQYTKARGFLLDAYHPQLKGGTGERLDWTQLPRDLSKPIILAGGLTPDNVPKAIQLAKPFAVDVSGGVELRPGIKDPAKISQFINEVRRGEK